MADSDPLPLNFNAEPLAPLVRELEWEAEERALRDFHGDPKWITGARLPRSLMVVARPEGAKPPSGLPPLFPLVYKWKPPRLGSLDALAWGYATTTPLQDAILIWLLWGHGGDAVRRAVLHRARHWPMTASRRDLIIETALIHAPALTYNQSPPAWLNYQTEFVNRVNEVLRWIDRELQAARQAITLTKKSKIEAICYNGNKGARNQIAPFSRLGNIEQARKTAPIFHARHPVNKHREVDANGKQCDKAA